MEKVNRNIGWGSDIEDIKEIEREDIEEIEIKKIYRRNRWINQKIEGWERN